ncbi:SURF1 family protein [Parasphingorhabdus sp. JC815]|uniref:SURF1 family protein n=1 Tax=Parasphingorhabdus sp. JC815 TaxID=3232140 RepID=UPI00345A09D8
MNRLPVVATFIALTAIATMIGLGIWQLQRAEWKDELLATYATARDQPAITYPSVPVAGDPPYFRRSTVNCLQVLGWRAVSGRNAKGESGWAHIAHCRTSGGEGPGAQIVAGWSRSSKNPEWTGGIVGGVIAPDSQYIVRLVANDPVAGLTQSQPPSTEDIPNNHIAYAVQWFLFAAIALIIYILALRLRNRR